MISVEDCGPGMPPEVVGSVFERSYRGEVDPNVPDFGLGCRLPNRFNCLMSWCGILEG